MTVDNTGFAFIYKTERCRSEIKNADNNLIYSYHFFYNPQENILRRIDFTNHDDPHVVDRVYDVWDVLGFRPMTYYPDDFGGDSIFYILGISQDNLKIFKMQIEKYGISHFVCSDAYTNTTLINLPLTKLTFLDSDEAATFLFYFNEYIKINYKN